MTPKFTKAMAKSAIADGAQVDVKRKVQRPPPPKIPISQAKDAELEALRGEISQLKQSLADEIYSAQTRAGELVAALSALSENKPMRLKPIRDMDRDSPTYLLVQFYDFVPVTYQPRKLDS